MVLASSLCTLRVDRFKRARSGAGLSPPFNQGASKAYLPFLWLKVRSALSVVEVGTGFVNECLIIFGGSP